MMTQAIARDTFNAIRAAMPGACVAVQELAGGATVQGVASSIDIGLAAATYGEQARYRGSIHLAFDDFPALPKKGDLLLIQDKQNPTDATTMEQRRVLGVVAIPTGAKVRVDYGEKYGDV